MAKNSVATVVRLIAPNTQIVKLDGELISQEADGLTFRYRQKGQRRLNEKWFRAEEVAAYSATVLYVQQSAVITKVEGQLGRNKTNGFLTIDDMNFNPRFSEAVADLGVEGSSAAPAKKKKKKA